MIESDKDWMVDKIFQTLQRQKFAEWYNEGRFNTWVIGEPEPKTIYAETIKDDIRELFGL